jgi:hypothetical protein
MAAVGMIGQRGRRLDLERDFVEGTETLEDDFEAIVQLIAATTTKAGLKVRAEIDPKSYPAGIAVKDAELAAVNLSRHDFHGEWNQGLLRNYTIASKSLSLER